MGDEAEHVPLHGLFLCGAVLHRGHHPSLLHDGQGVLLCAVSWPRVPPLWCEPDPCYSQERGICEVNQKMCCMYSEVQFPPGKDIGFGCCGVGCCRTSDDGPPPE